MRLVRELLDYWQRVLLTNLTAKIPFIFLRGFLIGTAFCAMAPTYELLMAARIFTGIFGGVIGSVSVAVISDIFKPEVRGRVMGFVQMSFAASQVLGLPIGLQLANMFDWHAPFWMIVMVGILVGIIILVKMQPLTSHLAYKRWKSFCASISYRIKTALFKSLF
jgi:predicted MFS family arabinose efflux permease